jgi:hypothetical protein
MKKVMNLQQLESVIATHYKDPNHSVHTNLRANFWKTEKKKELNLLFTISDSCFYSKGAMILSFDYNLKLTRIENLLDPQSKVGFNLVGMQLDYSDMKDYQKEVANRFSNLDRSKRVGHIVDNTFKPLTKTYFKNFPFERTYEVSSRCGCSFGVFGGLDNAQVFKNLCTKYFKNIQEIEIEDDSATTYTVRLKIKGKNVSFRLWQFFNYSLQVYVTNPKKDESLCLSDDNLESNQIEAVLEDLLANRKTTQIQALRIGKAFSHWKNQEISVIDPNRVQIAVKYNGDNKTPRGRYVYDIDFKKKSVSCQQTNSKVFVPNELTKLEDKLKTM